MATAATYRIQEDKYSASAEQALLKGEVQRQAQLRAQLEESIARQGALNSQLKQSQSVREQAIAREQGRYVATKYAEKKIDILRQGFTEISHVYNNISHTAAWAMKAVIFFYLRQHTDQVQRHLKYAYWALGLLCVMLLVHVQVIGLIAVLDGTKLTYQGPNGEADVRRAFQGMMSMRSHIFWHFMCGYIVFLILILVTVWVKFEQDMVGPTGFNLDDHMDLYVYGWTVSVLGWCIPMIRMARSYRQVRGSFRDDYKKELVEQVKRGDASIIGDTAFVSAIAPLSVQKKLKKQGVNLDDLSTSPSQGGYYQQPAAPTAVIGSIAPVSQREDVSSAGAAAIGFGGENRRSPSGGAHSGFASVQRQSLDNAPLGFGSVPRQSGGGTAALGLGSVPKSAQPPTWETPEDRMERAPPPMPRDRLESVRGWLNTGNATVTPTSPNRGRTQW
eukprot:Hpha_TRINITY_DN18508_c0_g1::TRINITY_DN18508_c0_g1_i1::g.195128::m.195128